MRESIHHCCDASDLLVVNTKLKRFSRKHFGILLEYHDSCLDSLHNCSIANYTQNCTIMSIMAQILLKLR